VRPTLIGIPYDASSSFMRGAAGAPPVIRQALHSPAGNPWSERLVEASSAEVLADAGDLELPESAEARTIIEDAIRQLAATGQPFIALGGDHSVTYPILRGLAGLHESLTILHIDAHPDLYDEFEGDRYSHACPFARIMEERLASQLVQVGVRAMTGHQKRQAERFCVEQIDMRAWADGGRPSIAAGPVYISIDLDGIDPAFAPGVSHREPGGLSVREVITLIDDAAGQIVGADIVELNPARDVSGITAEVAAKLVKELSARCVRPA
jgi:agmatinase